MRKISLLVVACLLTLNLHLLNTFAQDHTQWDLPNGATARFGKGWIRDIKFSPFGGQLAVATTIGVWIYDVRTGEEVDLLSGIIMSGANSISYSPGGLMLASAHWDHTIRLWDLNANTDRPRTTFRNHTGEIHTVTFSPDGSMLASGSADKTIRIWNPHTTIDSEKQISILPYRDSVNTAVFFP